MRTRSASEVGTTPRRQRCFVAKIPGYTTVFARGGGSVDARFAGNARTRFHWSRFGTTETDHYDPTPWKQ